MIQFKQRQELNCSLSTSLDISNKDEAYLVKIAVVEPINHIQNLKRAKEIKSSVSTFGLVDLLCAFDENSLDSSLKHPIRYLSLIPRLLLGRYDIVHFMNIYPLYPSILKWLTFGKTKCIYDISNYQSGIQITLGRSKILILITKFLERLFLNGSDSLVACGIGFDQFIKELSVKQKFTYFVPDPIDIKKYDLALSLSFKERVKFANLETVPDENHSFVLAYLSTFVNVKINNKYLPRGWELIYSIERINKLHNIKIKVFFLGKGNALDDLKRIAQEHDVLDQCYFFGFVAEEKLGLLLTICDLGFMEDYDTLGYKFTVGSKVQEYMAAGLPVLTGNSKEKTYMLRDQGLEFLLYSPPSISDQASIDLYISALTEAFFLSYNSTNKLKEAGKRNRIRAGRIFSSELVQKYILNVYSHLIGT